MAQRMSLPQIRAYDKRKAARHEAGHVAYGKAKGLPVSACLWVTPSLVADTIEFVRSST